LSGWVWGLIGWVKVGVAVVAQLERGFEDMLK
jgi:hypothetical protein